MDKPRSLFSLEGKIALVTGCRRGIGKAMADVLAEFGADIIGVSASLESDGGAVGESVRKYGRKFYPYQCDFGDRDSLKAFILQVCQEHPRIDILVNNAGTIMREPALTHPENYWDSVIDINLNSQFILTQAVAKGMLERKSGKIIFTASLLSFQGGINVPGYTASKHGIIGLAKALSNEWSSKGINVNAIAPGYIDTDNTEALRNDPVRSQQILTRIPSGRWGTADDLRGATVFLASDASNYVCGTVLTVDGGWMAR